MIKYIATALIAVSSIATSANAEEPTEETVRSLAFSYVKCTGHHAALAEGLDLKIGFKPRSQEELNQEFTKLSELRGAPDTEELAAAYQQAYAEAKTEHGVQKAFDVSEYCGEIIARVRSGELSALAMKLE